MSKHSEITNYNFKFKWFESKEEADEFCNCPDIEKMEESGYLKEDEILSEILENLKKLKKGDFSKPFKIENKKLYNEKFKSLYKDLISRLKKEIPVIINK